MILDPAVCRRRRRRSVQEEEEEEDEDDCSRHGKECHQTIHSALQSSATNLDRIWSDTKIVGHPKSTDVKKRMRVGNYLTTAFPNCENSKELPCEFPSPSRRSLPPVSVSHSPTLR